MTVPFKLLVLQNLTDAIKTITPANGYITDLADFDPGDGATMSRVYRGRPWFGDNDPIPMVSILEGTDQGDDIFEIPPDSDQGEYDFQALVQGFVSDDPIHPTDPAYYLERDLRRCLSKERRRAKPNAITKSPDPLAWSTWAPAGCAITAMSFTRGVIRPADDISSKAYCWLIVNFRILEAAEAP